MKGIVDSVCSTEFVKNSTKQRGAIIIHSHYVLLSVCDLSLRYVTILVAVCASVRTAINVVIYVFLNLCVNILRTDSLVRRTCLHSK